MNSLEVIFNFTLELKSVDTHHDYESDNDISNVIQKFAMLARSVHDVIVKQRLVEISQKKCHSRQ